MTPARVRAILQAAAWPFGNITTTWGGPLSMTPEERSYVLQVWDQMPGTTSLADVLRHIARRSQPATPAAVHC